MTTSVVPTASTLLYNPPLAESQPPPLENGDRLLLHEFMRRYEAMPEGLRAELIAPT